MPLAALAPKATPVLAVPSIMAVVTAKPQPDDGVKLDAVSAKRSRIEFQPGDEAGDEPYAQLLSLTPNS